jgi:AraC-like DNA-binding protein
MASPDPTSIAAEVAAEVTRLLTAAIAAYHRDEAGARVFSLAEAAERLHMSERTLTLGCRAGEITHTKIGKFRGLTAAQIEQYAAENTVSNGGPAQDEVAQAVALSRQSASRGTRRAA